MPLPTLTDWNETKTGLHQASRVVGAIRKAAAEPEPNWLHLSLRAVPEGLTTDVLPDVGEFVLNFSERAVIHTQDGKESARFSLEGHTPHSLTDALGAYLAEQGHTLELDR